MTTLHLTTRAAWRSWLAEHHDRETEIWLVYNKRHTGEPRVEYDAAVEEALCFGWIDSIVRTIDENRYAQKFTPRKAKSKWSESNLKLEAALRANDVAWINFTNLAPSYRRLYIRWIEDAKKEETRRKRRPGARDALL